MPNDDETWVRVQESLTAGHNTYNKLIDAGRESRDKLGQGVEALTEAEAKWTVYYMIASILQEDDRRTAETFGPPDKLH